jgi:hypothetical protein
VDHLELNKTIFKTSMEILILTYKIFPILDYPKCGSLKSSKFKEILFL